MVYCPLLLCQQSSLPTAVSLYVCLEYITLVQRDKQYGAILPPSTIPNTPCKQWRYYCTKNHHVANHPYAPSVWHPWSFTSSPACEYHQNCRYHWWRMAFNLQPWSPKHEQYRWCFQWSKKQICRGRIMTTHFLGCKAVMIYQSRITGPKCCLYNNQ